MDKLITIRTNQGVLELIDYLQDKTYIAVDTETTGVEVDSSIIGISVAAETGVAYYIILSYWDVAQLKLVHLDLRDSTIKLLNLLKEKSLIMHNGIFDCSMIYNNFRVQLIETTHTDTMVQSHVLDENRLNGLKELGVSIFGEDANLEQREMKASVLANGGVLTKQKYELYKADPELLARYGAKDTILTIKLFYEFTDKLFEENLDKFFYEDESMPLLRGPTYQLNTTGLKVDVDKLMTLRKELEAECADAKGFITKQVAPYVKDKYPGTKPNNTFNIGSGKQLSWLMFFKIGEPFTSLTKGGKELCKTLNIKPPYSVKAQKEFLQILKDNHGKVYEEAKFNPKTKKMSRPKKLGDPWNYVACTKESLGKLAGKYAFVKKLLEYSKAQKILNTYVIGLQERMQYGIIRPSFFQHGTTSGRYSSRNPNFQNLPRDDKRVKACIISRPGKSFVGADYSQLEPRVFASFSGDERLLKSFKDGHDFYSVIGMETFEKYDCTLVKDDSPDSFPVKYKKLRDIAKAVALSATYGTTAFKMSHITGKKVDECQEIIDSYFSKFPKVKKLMLESHELAKKHGRVENLFGRPRRIPIALNIQNIYGNTPHAELPYEVRNTLNLSINHRIQSTGASIINRASIAFCNKVKEFGIEDCHLVLQIHDELVVECKDEDAKDVVEILKYCMENTVTLPGVALIAEPKIAKNLADLK